MKKKKKLVGVYYIYAVYDNVSLRYKQVYYSTTDENFIRQYLPGIVLETPLRDLTVYRIGIFNDITGEIKAIPQKRIETRCYLFPRSTLSPVGENVTHEEVEKSVNETKDKLKQFEEERVEETLEETKQTLKEDD